MAIIPFLNNAYFGGDVGIGTDSPQAKLDIDSTMPQLLLQNSAGTNSQLLFEDNSGSTQSASITFDQAGQNALYITTNYDSPTDSNKIFLQPGGETAMTLIGGNNSTGNAGNVGIGIAAPTSLLHLSKAGGVTIKLGTSQNTSEIEAREVGGGNSLVFSSNNSVDNLIIDGSGAIKFNNYNSTNNTGTPTYLLGTDASGNIVKTNTVPGSAAGPYLPLAGGTMTGTSSVIFPDDFYLKIGTGQDLRIYHNSTSGSNIWNTVGHLTIQNTANGQDIRFFSDDGAGGNAEYFRVDGGSVATIFSKPISLSDGVKANFGTSDDLQIYHDGSNSYINETGTGVLSIQSDGTEVQINKGASEYMARFITDGAVNLYHNNVKKFATTSTGVTVTGAATATTFLGDLSGTINTVTTAVTKANATNDTPVATTAFVQNLIGTIPAGLVFQGTWNAATNTPTLASGTGTTGYFYIVSVAGTTNLDGITDWEVGDWAVFVEQGASDQWEKVDNSSVLDGSGTGNQITKWAGSGTSNTLTDSIITDDGTNVGIGTTSPTRPLSVQSSATSIVADFKYTTAAYSSIDLSNTVGAARISSVNSDLLLSPGMSEKMRITSAGNVGIGTAAPTYKLDVTGSIKASVQGRFGGGSAATPSYSFDADSDSGMFRATTNALGFSTAGTERMHIDASGDVGIGTSPGSNRLHVKGNVVGASITTRFEPQANNAQSTLYLSSTGSGDGGYFYNSNNNTAGLFSYGDYTFNVGTANISGAVGDPRMVIKQAGNIGIGLTAPQSKLQVDGGIQMSDDTDTAVAGKVGTMRYRTGTEYVEVDGVELVTNGDFATDTDWVKSTTQWTISGGKANYAGASTSALYQSITLTSAVTYRIRFTVSGATGGGAYVWIGNSAGSINYLGVSYKYYADGEHEEVFTMPSSQTTFTFYSNATSSSYSMDNVTLTEVTSEDASYADMCMQTGASTYEWVNIVRNTY